MSLTAATRQTSATLATAAEDVSDDEEGSSSYAMRVALDTTQRLAALKLLLDDAVISQAEFEDQRRSIIASI